jgi:hypothetical protein
MAVGHFSFRLPQCVFLPDVLKTGSPRGYSARIIPIRQATFGSGERLFRMLHCTIYEINHDLNGLTLLAFSHR